MSATIVTAQHFAEARIALELMQRHGMAPHKAGEICRGITEMDGMFAFTHLVHHTGLRPDTVSALLKKHGVLR